MKFYNRENELAILKKADELKSRRSVMTILIGRRRIGKTTLALQPFTEGKKLYFFISKKEESLLCEEFIGEIKERLAIPIFGTVTKFEDLFALLMEWGKTNPFTLIIDEFQEFGRVNSSIYSSIQKVWDLNKDDSKIHLIFSGSVYSLMKKIFEDTHEPLFGRADFKIHLQPFTILTLREILLDNNAYSSRSLLEFFILTGGVAKYIELFALYGTFEKISMIDEIIKPHSLFLDEGRNRLVEEFGKEYGVYFSILSLIANSKTAKSEIEGVLDKNVSGYLYRLEHDYSIIRSIKPFNAKPNSKVQKYEITDNFLAFWFRFVYKYQSLIEAENYDRLKDIVIRDFDTFSGKFLEKLFIELLKEEKKYTKIGSYWERNNQNEIDIVAVDDLNKEILIAEVKLNHERLSEVVLRDKAKNIVKQYHEYKIVYKLWSLHDL